MKVYVDQNTCIGCGMCAGIAEEVFRINAEGKAEVCTEGDEDAVQEVISSCPVEAVIEE